MWLDSLLKQKNIEMGPFFRLCRQDKQVIFCEAYKVLCKIALYFYFSAAVKMSVMDTPTIIIHHGSSKYGK